jgi:Tfp pilus assembly protein PilF
MIPARLLCALLLAANLTGCSVHALQDIGSPLGTAGARTLLADGIRDYEDGNYRQAARKLKDALDAGLATRSDRATAHKYLAFISCVSNRQIQCREEFRLALAADPRFELSPVEAGHPIWGPVFRSVKERST